MPGGGPAGSRVRVEGGVDRESDDTLQVTTRRCDEATAAQVAGQSGRNHSRVDESPGRVERNQPAGDRDVRWAGIRCEDAAAAIRIRRDQDQRHPFGLHARSTRRGRSVVGRRRRASQERDRDHHAPQRRSEDPFHAREPRPTGGSRSCPGHRWRPKWTSRHRCSRIIHLGPLRLGWRGSVSRCKTELRSPWHRACRPEGGKGAGRWRRSGLRSSPSTRRGRWIARTPRA